MLMKWIGTLCIISGCGGWGFITVVYHVRKIQFCRQFLSMLDYVECELAYRATALPQLCVQAAERSKGMIRECLLSFSKELEAQIAPNLSICMSYALDRRKGMDDFQRSILMNFAENLGHFDIAGQLKGLAQVKQNVDDILAALLENKENRLKSYQTLGICAGVALAIILV